MKYIYLIVIAFTLGCAVNHIPAKYFTGDVVNLKTHSGKFLVEEYNSIYGYYRLSYFDETGYVRHIHAYDYAIKGRVDE